MMEPYARATLFLTYIQGGNTTEWVDQLGDWLEYQVDLCNPHCTTVNNEWLWNSVELAFNRQYADKLTQECAMAELKAGIKMKGEELDDYISHFEALVRHVGLAIRSASGQYIHSRTPVQHVQGAIQHTTPAYHV